MPAWTGRPGRKVVRADGLSISPDGRGLNGRGLDLASHAQLTADAVVDRLVDFGVLLQELLGVLPALAEPLASVREPRAALFDDALLDAQIQQVACSGDAFAVHHVELGLAEGRRDLVLHHLQARKPADDHVAVLYARDAADVHPHRRVELQRAAARSGFRIAEHHA